jgi:GDSL-like Lipase/Acylhydrolase family
MVPMLRRISRTVAAVLAGLVLAALVTELFFRLIVATPLRWVMVEPQVALFGPDFATGYRHRVDVSGMWLTEHRNFIRTSNLGLRDRDRPLAHGAGPRAVIVGNSIIEAVQVEESQTSSAVAERILSRQRPGAEVVNLGLSGAKPAVLVARLQTQGLALSPDLAIVVVDVGDLINPATTDDREFTGYRPDAAGEFHVSYGFRNTSGYRFRTSRAGRAFYWLLDHSEVARIINDRKNVGIFAELPLSAAAQANEQTTMYPADSLDPYVALWIKGEPAGARAVFDAFIRDLAAIHRDNKLPIIVATRNIKAGRPGFADKRAALIGVIRAQIEGAGLRFIDLDAREVAAVGADRDAELYGFGANLGIGHLNAAGNRIYGEIFADVIAPALPR